MKNGCVVDLDGSKHWCKDNNLHRADGPAIERFDGTKSWWYKGVFVGFGDKPDPALWERLTSTEINGGPLLNGCVVDLDGDKFWYKDDQLHREDGPAIDSVVGKQWYFNGERLGLDDYGFWDLWDRLTDEQRANPTLLKWMPR